MFSHKWRQKRKTSQGVSKLELNFIVLSCIFFFLTDICRFFELSASFHIYKGLWNVHIVRFDVLVCIAILVRKEFLINYSCMYYLDLIEKVIVRLKASMVKSSVKLKLFSKRFLILLTILFYSLVYLVLITWF